MARVATAISDDSWLAPLVRECSAASRTILDIGCGPGLDSAVLEAAGFRVVAFDRSIDELAQASANAKRTYLVRADLGRPLPFRDGSFDAAVASLSLHYLPWTETLTAFAEVRRVLVGGAVFAFRVNASDDFNFGAGQGEEVEPGLFRSAAPAYARFKRFFDEAAVRAAIANLFDIIRLRHATIDRYESPKQVWDCLARTR